MALQNSLGVGVGGGISSGLAKKSADSHTLGNIMPESSHLLPLLLPMDFVTCVVTASCHGYYGHTAWALLWSHGNGITVTGHVHGNGITLVTCMATALPWSHAWPVTSDVTLQASWELPTQHICPPEVSVQCLA
jgi:hypothetical protein